MKLRRKPELAFKGTHTITFPGLARSDEPNNYYGDMIKWLDNEIKPGERFGLICKIVLTNDGQDLYDHILIVYKTKSGELRFYDPQNGLDSAYYFNIRFRHKDKKVFYPKIFRVDNADLNIEYLNQISKISR